MPCELLTAILQRIFSEHVASGTFVAVDSFNRLAQLASNRVALRENPQIAVAFSLAAFFNQCSERMSEVPVSASEAMALHSQIMQPVAEAISFLVSGGEPEKAVSVIATLARLTPNGIGRN
jgi:hypothetical protein